jgi:hypothetical protein
MVENPYYDEVREVARKIRSSNGGIQVETTVFGQIMFVLDNYRIGNFSLSQAAMAIAEATKLTEEEANSGYKI